MSLKTRLVDVTVKVVVEVGTEGEWPDEATFRDWAAQNAMYYIAHVMPHLDKRRDPMARLDWAKHYLDGYEIIEETEDT